MKLKEQMFDFEVFPEWWCCVLGKYPENDDVQESIKDDFLVVTSDMPDAQQILLSTMNDRNYVNMGYNIKRYDNIILNGIACGFTPNQLKILNDIIINPESENDDIEHMRIAPFARKRYSHHIYQDMFDDNVGSLKEKEACLQLDIRETTIPFNKKNLTSEDKQEIISYCKHDVWSSMMFYKIVLKPFVATKLLVGEVFNIPIEACYASTNANLSAKATSAKRVSYPDANRLDIEIPEGLKNYIKYSLPGDIVTRLCASPDNFNITLFGNTVSYANGGIHSTPCDNLIVESTDDWKLINVDASSFYPAIMINWHTLSRAIKEPEKFASMYQTRLDYKNVIGPFEDKYGKNVKDAPIEEYKHYKYCKDTSQAYKLILNTTFGASGNKYLDLYDPYMTTKTCRLGQLLLTSLANNAYNQIGKDKIQIIQTNTDGVLFYVRKDMVPLLEAIGEEFTRVTNILLEFENEIKIWQKNVNNYIMSKNSGREKAKGGFFVTDTVQPGHNRTRPLDSYVCREAIKQYLMFGKNIMEHILSESDISKFVITCHKGSFGGILREFNDGRPDEILHKVNRAYASKNKSLGMIMKTKKLKGVPKKYKAPGCPPHCELLNNDLSTYDISTLRDDIDYMWYISNTIELLNEQWYEMHNGKIVPTEILDIDNM